MVAVVRSERVGATAAATTLGAGSRGVASITTDKVQAGGAGTGVQGQNAGPISTIYVAATANPRAVLAYERPVYGNRPAVPVQALQVEADEDRDDRAEEGATEAAPAHEAQRGARAYDSANRSAHGGNSTPMGGTLNVRY